MPARPPGRLVAPIGRHGAARRHCCSARRAFPARHRATQTGGILIAKLLGDIGDANAAGEQARRAALQFGFEQGAKTAAFVSQSGAFMITRLSKRPELDPAYMISVGNQNDLTLGDLVKYLDRTNWHLQLAIVAILESVTRYEPRVKLLRVDVHRDAQTVDQSAGGRVTLQLVYRLQPTGTLETMLLAA